VSGKVWQKYESVKTKCLKVELTVESTDKKLQRLGEVGVADRLVKAREITSHAVSGRRTVEL
jgi:hypothetical protein